ncbi:IQ motif and SEC7 domain-containing protein 3 [Bienertia sinuspersici]
MPDSRLGSPKSPHPHPSNVELLFGLEIVHLSILRIHLMATLIWVGGCLEQIVTGKNFLHGSMREYG